MTEEVISIPSHFLIFFQSISIGKKILLALSHSLNKQGTCFLVNKYIHIYEGMCIYLPNLCICACKNIYFPNLAHYGRNKNSLEGTNNWQLEMIDCSKEPEKEPFDDSREVKKHFHQ